MAKRPRFSRWRRLPPVFRTGEHRPIGTGDELDRIILYLPSRVLDLAEALAEKAGIPALQEYCERLLTQAIEAEQIRQKVSGFEARRGVLEGLKEIAEDADYLAEWQARDKARPAPVPRPPADAITVDMVLADGDEDAMPTDPDEGGVWFVDPPEPGEAGSSPEGEPPAAPPSGAVSLPGPSRPSVRVFADADAMGVLGPARRPRPGRDGVPPLPPRGVPVPPVKSAELRHALTRLELQHRGAEVLDRQMAHALHRLALESQVLLTDAWPGVFDERMIATIRAVQEAVERILSGQDIRY